MKVPFINLKSEWKFFEKKFVSTFKKVGRSGVYVLGSEVEQFENDFAKYCGYSCGVGVSTGLSALEVSLRAYDIGEGDEVITVANTAVATVLAISSVGAKPIFCDIGDDFLIDPSKIEALITHKTKAVIPVHLFGKICNMKAINLIAKKHKLIIIEDACQAHGANFKNESAKNTKAFSFYPTKNLGTMGEGGAIVSNDKKVRDFALSYRNYGQQGRYNHVIKATNYRLEPLHCALLNLKLKYLDKFTKIRQGIAKNYITELKNIEGIIINDFDPTSSYHLFVIRVLDNQRDELQDYLKKQGIETLVHYPTVVHEQPCYKNEYLGLELEKTDKFQEEILSLPCHVFLGKAELNTIVASINKFIVDENR